MSVENHRFKSTMFSAHTPESTALPRKWKSSRSETELQLGAGRSIVALYFQLLCAPVPFFFHFRNHWIFSLFCSFASDMPTCCSSHSSESLCIRKHNPAHNFSPLDIINQIQWIYLFIPWNYIDKCTAITVGKLHDSNSMTLAIYSKLVEILLSPCERWWSQHLYSFVWIRMRRAIYTDTGLCEKKYVAPQ